MYESYHDLVLSLTKPDYWLIASLYCLLHKQENATLTVICKVWSLEQQYQRHCRNVLET